jgi:hypothetical protein
MHRSSSRGWPFALAFSVLLLAGPGAAPVSAQCTITGPSSICSGSATLCGPNGPYEWHWTGPNGFAALTQCVTIADPGTYTLRLWDMNNALWSAPCSQTVSGGASTPCGIDGAASACAGEHVSLCGPSGAFTYAWTGPGGFTSTASCVNVGVGGSYQLVVTDPATGCASAPCTHDVTFTTCGGTAVNCPRPAWYWRSQCARGRDDTRNMTSEQLAALAACVDEHTQAFAWSSASEGLCRALRPPVRCNLRLRAKRQFAAVAANVCAGAQGLTAAGGTPIGLDLATAVHLGDLSTTVGAWLADADQQLVSLESASLDRHSVKESYRRLIQTGWMINHAHGIGSACGAGDGPEVWETVAPGSAADAESAGETDESLASEMADETDATLSIEGVAPNPFSSQATIAYVLSSAAADDVQLSVYDLSGRQVRELVHARQAPGRYDVQWDGRGDDGQPVRGGMYFIHGRAGAQPIQTRVTLLR